MDIQKPKKWRSILAWISIIFGGIGILSSFGGDSVADIIGGIFLGLAPLLPGVWWMFCNNRDRKVASAYATSLAQHEQLSGFLKDSDPTIVAGMGIPERPQASKRHWGTVSATAITMLVIDSTITPTSENTAKVTEPAAAKSAQSSTSSSTSTSTRETTSITTSSEEPSPVQQNFAEIPETVVPVVEPVIEEAPASTPVVEEAPVVQEAPASAPSYKTCTAVWNAIGRPITISDPGYASRHDNDSIGCEKGHR